jgi:NAD+ kinase
MSKSFETIALVGKHGDAAPQETIAKLSRFLVERGHQVVLEDTTPRRSPGHGLQIATLEEIGGQCDLAIVVGGDGTLLRTARSLAEYDVPLLGINLGRLGFLVDVSPDTMLTTLGAIFSGHYEEENRSLLVARIDGQMATALNDVVVHKWNSARMIEFETYIDGTFVDVQRSDGLIISTPTGSTAYALSGGGPLLHPDLDATLLVPICPHRLSNRPIVVSGRSIIEIRVCGHTELSHVRVTCDGQTCLSLGENRIRVEKYDHQVRLIHPSGHDHFEILRAKLGWGENSPRKQTR